MSNAFKEDLSEEDAMKWLLNQTIVGVEVTETELRLIFKSGYFEISGDAEMYVETATIQ